MKEQLDVIWDKFDQAQQKQDENAAEALKAQALALIASMPKNEIKLKTTRVQ